MTFLPLLYLAGGGRPDLPKEILLNAEIDSATALTEALVDTGAAQA